MTVRTLRNLGIGAHIDAGKTTLAERMLLYTGRIRVAHDVGGKGPGATLDHIGVEKAHGITVSAAATTAQWGDTTINLVDTPGHVDFTAEVERALRVLDGAILVVDAIAGAQAQTHTVNRQMDRHGVARIVFVNKVDKPGADPLRVAGELEDSLGLTPVLLQLPWGTGRELRGVIDVVRGVAYSFEGEQGREVVRHSVPPELRAMSASAREAAIEAATMVSDELAGQVLAGGSVSPEQLEAALRVGVLEGVLHPVFLGSAHKNIGVQPLLDAVVSYLPGPEDVQNVAFTPEGDEVVLDGAETVAFAFKAQAGDHGSLTWLRLMQGGLRKGQSLTVQRTGRRVRVGRLGRLHGGRIEAVDEAVPGDIVAAFGLDAVTGDTLTDDLDVACVAFELPEPVVEARLVTDGPSDRLAKALGRLLAEDPTLAVFTDPESGELRLRGMGELHLQIAVERLQDEHGVTARLGRPSVSMRRRIRGRATFDHLHRKQGGGPGQYARVSGWIEPSEGGFVFDWEVVGGAIPVVYRRAVESGFRDLLEAGFGEGIPVLDVRVVITGGATHSNDSSEQAFYAASAAALRGCFADARPQLLEPVMTVSAEADGARHGAVLSTLMQRRGAIRDAVQDGRRSRVEAEVPLEELFGFASALRSATGGTGEYAVAFSGYRPVA
ncbi:MAG: elongation factor G [Deltaproteobacteria bacterium]|nr:elongation factor G [Deltaproteobacteria bacterium]